MRILAVTSWYPPHHFGGYEIACRDIMDQLSLRGHQITVLTSNFQLPGVLEPDTTGSRYGTTDRSTALAPGNLEDQGTVTILRDQQLWIENGEEISASWSKKRQIELANIASVQKAFAQVQPELVTVWQAGAMSVSTLLTLSKLAENAGIGKPVCILGDEWPTYFHKQDQWQRMTSRLGPVGGIVARLSGTQKWAFEISTFGAAGTGSATTRNRIEKFTGHQFEPTHVVGMGVDPNRFVDHSLRPNDPAQTNQVTSNGSTPDLTSTPPDRLLAGPRLLCVGRSDPRKGFDTAVKALVHLSNASLEIRSTDKAHNQALAELAQNIGVDDRLEFTSGSESELGDAYRSCDVVLFPSVWPEPFGLIPLEAFAVGKPVAYTGAGGTAEFLTDGVTAAQFEPNDPIDLAAAVRYILEDSKRYERLISRSRELANQLGIGPLADRIECLYSQVAGKDPPGSDNDYFEPSNRIPIGNNYTPQLDEIRGGDEVATGGVVLAIQDTTTPPSLDRAEQRQMFETEMLRDTGGETVVGRDIEPLVITAMASARRHGHRFVLVVRQGSDFDVSAARRLLAKLARLEGVAVVGAHCVTSDRRDLTTGFDGPRVAWWKKSPAPGGKDPSGRQHSQRGPFVAHHFSASERIDFSASVMVAINVEMTPPDAVIESGEWTLVATQLAIGARGGMVRHAHDVFVETTADDELTLIQRRVNSTRSRRQLAAAASRHREADSTGGIRSVLRSQLLIQLSLFTHKLFTR